MASLHLLLHGPPVCEGSDGRRIALSPRDGALLAWLALEGPTPRQRLAALLWPHSAPDAARNALRQRLFTLKKQFGDSLLGGQDPLALAPGVTHDLHEADSVLAEVSPEAQGELAEWLSQQRARRGQRVRQSLVELADMAEGVRDWDDALSHARELLALDPLSEDAHRRVIRLHYLAGDRSAALLAFDACERLLKDEVGVRPSDETLALLKLIETPQAPTAPTPPPPAAALSRPPVLVGRIEEHQALLEAWQSGTPALVLGEPGMGKSRLLEDWVAAWPGAVMVRARPGDAAVPLAVLGRLVTALSGVPKAGALRRTVAALRAVQSVPSVQSMPSGPPALAGGSGGAAPAARPAAQPLAPLLQQDLVEALGSSPAPALVFDDWQFADAASVAALSELFHAPALATLRWAVASRTGAGPQADARLADLRREGRWRVLTLRPLPPEAIAALLRSIDLAPDESPELAQALARRVGGNPLYVLEALRHMLMARVPLRAAQVTPPHPVRTLVAERMAQLPPSARQLLHLAAVANGDFSVELAEAVTGRHALELAEAWGALEQQGLFGPHGTAHDLHAEVALAQLPGAIARVLHARVATWLEGQAHEPARLAAHWHAAGDDERAWPHWLAAAHRAWHAARSTETFDFFSKAAQQHGVRGRRAEAFELWFACADAMTELGPPTLVVPCLHALEALAATEGERLRVRFVQEVLRVAQGNAEDGLRGVAQLTDEALRLGDVRVESECRFAAASRASADGRFDEALEHLAASEALLRRAGDPRRATSMAASVALVRGLRGQPRRAASELECMLPRLLEHKDHGTWAVVSASLAVQHIRLGNAAAARDRVRRTRAALADAAVSPTDLAIVLRHLLEALRWCGDYAEALSVAEGLLDRLAPQGEFPGAQRASAQLFLALGRADRALALLTKPTPQAPTRQRESLHLGLLQVQRALAAGEPVAHWPEGALNGEDLALAAEWALWSGLSSSSPWTPEALDALRARCEASDLALFVAPLQALSDWRAGRQPQERPSVHAAEPWTALFQSQAWLAVGHPAQALQAAQAGAQWLHRTAERELPFSQRDAFLHRNPAHRKVLALAARLARLAD